MTHQKDYQAALDYIYSFIDFSLTKNLRYSPEKFNLDRMVEYLDMMGNPHLEYPVIHVAGTKGKGSICAMLTSILAKAGYQTGFYSSPHMIEFTERIRIGDCQITENEVSYYCGTLKDIIEKIDGISTFEIITGLAFRYFADKKVEFAVIEVGMGGRFDATNVVQPMLTAISSISLDHTQVLGNTIEKIAFEKAGIIKEGVPLIISPQKNSAEKVIELQAGKIQAKLIKVSEHISYKNLETSLDGQKIAFRFKTENTNGKTHQTTTTNLEVFSPLLGDHQIENIATAILVVRELAQMGINIPDEAIKAGLKEIKWQGRFEVIHQNPILIVDGAHNLDSFYRLRDTIKANLRNKKITLIFGVSEDKQVKLMLKAIRPVVDYLIITQSTHPRAMAPEEIEDFAKSLNFEYSIAPNIQAALEKAAANVGSDGAIIASGSLFIAGAVKKMAAEKGF